MTSGFGDFGKLGFEKFGVVALKPEGEELFGAAKALNSRIGVNAPAADFKVGLAHDDSAFNSAFDISHGGNSLW